MLNILLTRRGVSSSSRYYKSCTTPTIQFQRQATICSTMIHNTSTSETGEEDTVDLLSLATSCLASSMAASEPIRRIALEAAVANSLLIGAGCSSSGSSSSTSSLFLMASSLSVNDSQDVGSNGNTSMVCRSKLDGTVVTDADGAAQKVIVDAIRSVHSSITIVREESDEEENRLLWSSNRSLTVEQAIGQDDDDDDDDDEAKIGRRNNKINVDDDGLNLNCWTSIYNYAHQQIQDCMKRHQLSGDKVKVDPNRVSVFVDPLDGTKNYAKGQYDCVSTLVAIVLDNTPIFGVICKPFGQDSSPSTDNHIPEEQQDDAPTKKATTASPCVFSNYPPCFAVYGGTLLQGVYVADCSAAGSSSSDHGTSTCGGVQSVCIPQDQPVKAVISSSRSGGIVKDICAELHAKGMLITKDPVLVSGAGEKALRLLIGTNGEALWPFPRSGTSLWDVAAADALLQAVGGCLTDKHGLPMNYLSAATQGGSTDNSQGIIASNRKELHQACVDAFGKIEKEHHQQTCLLQTTTTSVPASTGSFLA